MTQIGFLLLYGVSAESKKKRSNLCDLCAFAVNKKGELNVAE
jgi:hypothetical protein